MEQLPIVEREVVRLIVLDAEEQILLFHIHEPLYPDVGTCWELPGGGIDSGETYVTAALRDLHEETGMAARPSLRQSQHPVSDLSARRVQRHR